MSRYAKISPLLLTPSSILLFANLVSHLKGLKTHGNRLRDFTTEYDRRITRVASTMTEEFTGINQKVDQLRAEFVSHLVIALRLTSRFFSSCFFLSFYFFFLLISYANMFHRIRQSCAMSFATFVTTRLSCATTLMSFATTFADFVTNFARLRTKLLKFAMTLPKVATTWSISANRPSRVRLPSSRDLRCLLVRSLPLPVVARAVSFRCPCSTPTAWSAISFSRRTTSLCLAKTLSKPRWDMDTLVRRIALTIPGTSASVRTRFKVQSISLGLLGH